eukprot:2929328-Amphidinium_carterae.2
MTCLSWLRQFHGSLVRLLFFSDGEHVFDNPVFKRRALDLGIGICKSHHHINLRERHCGTSGRNLKDASETSLGLQ